jgi:hypothetical protein
MPPKKEKKEVKAIFDHLESRLWWEYSDYTQEETNKIDEFFTIFQEELKLLVNPDFRQSIENISKALGVWIHPAFAHAVSEIPLQKNPASDKPEAQ